MYNRHYIDFNNLLYYASIILVLLTNIGCAMTPKGKTLDEAILTSLNPKSDFKELLLIAEEPSLNSVFNLKPLKEKVLERAFQSQYNFAQILGNYLGLKRNKLDKFYLKDITYEVDSDELKLIENIFNFYSGNSDQTFYSLIDEISQIGDQSVNPELKSVKNINLALSLLKENRCGESINKLKNVSQSTSLTLELLAIEIICKIELGKKDLGQTLNTIIGLPEARYSFTSLIPSLDEESSGLIDLITIKNGLYSLSFLNADTRSFELYLLAYAAANKRLIGATLSAINLAVQYDSSFSAAKMFMARILIALNHGNDAIDTLTSIPSNHSLFIPAHLQAALVARKLDMPIKSFGIIQKAIEEKPKVKTFWQFISNPNLQKHPNFSKYQIMAARNFPTDFKISYNRGQYLHAKGRSSEARKMLKKALVNTSDAYQKAELANFIAYSFLEDKMFKKAYKYSKFALALVPDDGYFLDTLGWAYVQDGQIEKSIPVLQEAVKLAKEDPIIWYHLAYALDKTGSSNAILAYKKSLAFGIQNENNEEFDKHLPKIKARISEASKSSTHTKFLKSALKSN